jgi:hypothetical protein
MDEFFVYLFPLYVISYFQREEMCSNCDKFESSVQMVTRPSLKYLITSSQNAELKFPDSLKRENFLKISLIKPV